MVDVADCAEVVCSGFAGAFPPSGYLLPRYADFEREFSYGYVPVFDECVNSVGYVHKLPFPFGRCADCSINVLVLLDMEHKCSYNGSCNINVTRKEGTKMENAKYTAAFLDGEFLVIVRSFVSSASDFRKTLSSCGHVVLKVWEGDIPDEDVLTWYNLQFSQVDVGACND